MEQTLLIRGLYVKQQQLEASDYVLQIPSIATLKSLDFKVPITFFVGENGSGKSTLLEGIACAFGLNPEGGSKDYHFSTMATHSSLGDAMTLVKGTKRADSSYFLRAESFYNVASQAEAYRDHDPKQVYYEKYGGKSLHEQSHGESFLNLMKHTFTANGLYLLDEPEAALSPQRQLSLLLLMHDLAKQGAQFIVATHSPILLGMPNAQILSFTDKIQSIAYEECESYQIMKMFITNREYMLKHLLEQ